MNVTIADIVIGSVFAVWLLVSIAGQWKFALMSRLRTVDFLHLIPNWRFFAPRPSRRDYHLDFRVQIGPKQTTRWTRLPMNAQRRLTSTIWYPEKRVRKTFNTAVRRIIRRLRASGPDAVAQSLAYLQLLHYVQNHPELPEGCWTQFRIVSSQDYAVDTRPRTAFVSPWHQR